MTRWFQIKMLPTTKFHNISRSTKFILVIWSSDIVVVTLFINLIYLSSTFMKLIWWEIWERCRFYEQRYCRFVKWRNDQNKLYRSWEVIHLCSWKVFHLNSFRASKSALKNWFAEGQKKNAHGKMPLCRVPKQRHSAKTHFAVCRKIALGKIHLCRVPEKCTRQRRILPCTEK